MGFLCGGAAGVVQGWTYTTDGAWADQILLTETVPDLYRNGPAQAGTGR
ncbi:MAG: hypothetical protein ACRDTD_13215 [Pseudonocardiaceae bacterium]